MGRTGYFSPVGPDGSSEVVATVESLPLCTAWMPDGTLAIVSSPDGRLLASGEGNSAVRVWDVRTGKQLHHFGMGPQNASNYTYSVSFMKAGDLLACGTEDQHVVVWRIPELSR